MSRYRFGMAAMVLVSGVSPFIPAQAHRSAPAPWHRVQRVIDVTGDGKPDTLTLTAFGSQPDTLDVVLQIRSSGRVAFTDRWVNTDEFIDDDSTMVKDRRALARQVRREMDDFFDDRNFTPIRDDSTLRTDWKVGDASDCGPALDCVAFFLRFERAKAARIARGLPSVPDGPDAYGAFIDGVTRSPFDTALVRRIGSEWRGSRALSFTYSHGYETTKTIVWSAVARRFFTVFECC